MIFSWYYYKSQPSVSGIFLEQKSAFVKTLLLFHLQNFSALKNLSLTSHLCALTLYDFLRVSGD